MISSKSGNNRRRLLQAALCAGGLIGAAACSSYDPHPMPEDFRIASLELYLSRAAFSEADFEQYKLSGAVLFSECGELRRGRHTAREQGLKSLPPETVAQITAEVWRLKDAVPGLRFPFEAPGESRSMFDPGQVTLKAELPRERLEVKTSVDGLVPPANRGRAALLKLAKLMRGAAGPVHCGAADFFGIGAVTPEIAKTTTE